MSGYVFLLDLNQNLIHCMNAKNIPLVLISVLVLGIVVVLVLSKKPEGSLESSKTSIDDYEFKGRAKELKEEIEDWEQTSWLTQKTKEKFIDLKNDIDNAHSMGNIEKKDRDNLQPILLNHFIDKLQKRVTIFFSSSNSKAEESNLLLDDVRYLMGLKEFDSGKKIRTQYDNLNYFNQLCAMEGKVNTYKNTSPFKMDLGMDLFSQINGIEQRDMLAGSPLVKSIADKLKQDLRSHMVQSLKRDIGGRMNAYITQERYSAGKSTGFNQEFSNLRNNQFIGSDNALISFISQQEQKLNDFFDFDEAFYYTVEKDRKRGMLNCADLCSTYKAYQAVCDSL